MCGVSGQPLKKVCFRSSGRVTIFVPTGTFFFSKRKDFTAARVAMILATRQTGNKLFLKVASGSAPDSLRTTFTSTGTKRSNSQNTNMHCLLTTKWDSLERLLSAGQEIGAADIRSRECESVRSGLRLFT